MRLDVDSARLAVRAAKATIGAVDDALASAREQLRLAEQRYSTGVGNIIELTDAQVAYTTAAAPGRPGALWTGLGARAAPRRTGTDMIQENPVLARPRSHADRPQRSSPVTRIVLLILLVGVVGGTASCSSARVRKQAAVGGGGGVERAANRVIPVLTADVAQRDVPVWLEGLGNVAAFYTVTVKTQVDGRIDRVRFTEGQHVKKGDVLVQIDPRPFADPARVGAGGRRARRWRT